MEAMILNDSQKEWMQPLLDIRNELDVEDDRDNRDYRRMGGGIDLYDRKMDDGTISVEPIPGPYTRYWREYWLRRVLETQTHIRKTAPLEMRDITLITLEELSEIRRIWLEQKHEFDDSLPRIYKEATGTAFTDNRSIDERTALGNEEWEALKEVCGDDENQLELMASLLSITDKQRRSARRTNVFKPLEQAFARSGQSRESAIAGAQEKHELSAAASEGVDGVAKVKQLISKPEDTSKQLSWADIKFSQPNNQE